MRETKAVRMIKTAVRRFQEVIQGLMASAYLLMPGIVLTCPHQTLWTYNNPEFEMVKRFGGDSILGGAERGASLKMNFDFYESQAPKVSQMLNSSA